MASSKADSKGTSGMTDVNGSHHGDIGSHSSAHNNARKGKGKMPAHEVDALAQLTGKLRVSAPTFEPGRATMATVTKMGVLASNSTADTSGPVIVSSSSTFNTVGVIGEGNRSPSSEGGAIKVVFSTDTGPNVAFVGSHYLKITNIDLGESEAAVHHLTGLFKWDNKIRSMSGVPNGHGSRHMVMYLCIDDLRDAEAIKKNIAGHAPSTWETEHIQQAEYAAHTGSATEGKHVGLSCFDGQIMLVAKYQGSLADIQTKGVADKIRLLALTYGEVLAFKEMRQPGSSVWQFRVEYFKMSDAEKIIHSLTDEHPHTFSEWSVIAIDITAFSKTERNTAMPATTPAAGPHKAGNLTLTSPAKAAMREGDIFCSPTGRTAWRIGEDGSRIMCSPPTQVEKTYPTSMLADSGMYSMHRDRFLSEPLPQRMLEYPIDARAQSWAGPSAASAHYSEGNGFARESLGQDMESQRVVLNRITDGQDVRTTVMMRNLPNRWASRDLKACLDNTVFGKYDFSYVRIDFANNTNVGYAFVNFVDAMDIVSFFDHQVGRDWVPGLHPQRVCAVSYATIQGYDCLVEKFRNSAVMEEYDEYRPKLWWTGESAPYPSMVGMERPFPEPNNLSKKQRSHDNAGHIGLFAPRSTAAHRGVDRNRRSQYDRGTTAQIQEDAYYGISSFDPNYTTRPAQYNIAHPMNNLAMAPYAMGNGYGAAHGVSQSGMQYTRPGYMAQEQPTFAPTPVYGGLGPFYGNGMGMQAPGLMPTPMLRPAFGGPVMGANGFGDPSYTPSYFRTPRTLYEEPEGVAPDGQPAQGTDGGVYKAHGVGFGQQH